MDDTAPLPVRAPVEERARRSPWRTVLWIGVVILATVIVAVVLSRCVGKRSGGGPGGFGPGVRPPVTVATDKAVAGDMPIRLEALGTVTPEATIQVVPRVAGLLDKVSFKEGQRVSKGQLLAQIDPRPFQAALDQARGQLLKDQAALADAKLDMTRYRTLLAQDSIARQQVDTQVALVKQDEAAVIADQANVTAARLNLSFTAIQSPVAGRTGLRQVDPGNQIVANQTTPITVVTQLDPIDVVFAIPEDAIAEIAKGSGGSGGGLQVTALDRSGGTPLATGVLATLDNEIDATTGTVKGKARFANPTGALFPNQFVNVSILVDTLKNQVIVPTTAVRHGPQGDFVWVLQADRTVKARSVKVGPGTTESVSIAQGLNIGETVITEGGDRLRDGGKVNLPGQRPNNRTGARAGGGRWSGAGGGHWGRRGGGQGGGSGGGQGGGSGGGSGGGPGQ